jgi:hypothetical protein
MSGPIIRLKINTIKPFKSVASPHKITGKNIMSRKNAPLKIPVRAPISVLTRQSIPKGACERKPIKTPDKKPEVCPVIVPFTYAEKTRIQRARSGTALKKET